MNCRQILLYELCDRFENHIFIAGIDVYNQAAEKPVLVFRKIWTDFVNHSVQIWFSLHFFIGGHVCPFRKLYGQPDRIYQLLYRHFGNVIICRTLSSLLRPYCLHDTPPMFFKVILCNYNKPMFFLCQVFFYMFSKNIS